MKNTFSRHFFALGLFAFASIAQGQLTINGVTDKTVYNDSATFTVVTQAGYNYSVLLDTNPVSAGTPVAVASVDYHELRVSRTNQTTLDVTNRLIRFIVRSSARGSTEDGLPPWTPWPMINSAPGEFAGGHLRMIAPQDFPAGYEIPVVAWVENDQGHAVRVNGPLNAPGQPSIQIKRGTGSGFLAATNPAGPLPYAASLSSLQSSNLINLETSTVWTSVSGTLSGSTAWPTNSRIAVTGDLTIPAGSSLAIGEGSVVRLNSGVNINLNGQLFVNGTTNRPVVFMPVTRAQPWGGFLLQAATSQINATGAVFVASGAVQNWFGTGGHPGSHRPEQALFYCSTTATLSLVDCATIFLAGQLGHAVSGGTFTFTHFLMQHTTTGGEFTGTAFTANDSAFIECPDDSTNFVDGDNDALYFINGTQAFTNTLFGWTKDDAVDSGGSGAGLLNFQNCWFESTFHEGSALSGTGKIVNHYGSVFINCGQGLESGYDGPVGTMFGCLATANLTGGRFGDNYNWTYTGFLRATNSLLLYNYRDVWGMNWQDWTYRTNAMDIRSNFLSAPNIYHPSNAIWQPSSDGWRLAAFMTTPPEAGVGIGLAMNASSLGFDAITNGVPVRLSSFTTNLVSVGYSLEVPGQTILSGTMPFQPGETLKFIPAPATPPGGANIARLHLGNPFHAVITGNDTLYFIRTVSPDMNLQLLRLGSDWVLFWTDPAAFLQQADGLNLPWSDVPAASPCPIEASAAQKFYRLRKPGP